MTWPIHRLGDLCTVSIGRTPRRDNLAYWGGPGVWVTVRELDGQVIEDSVEHVSELALADVMPAPVAPGTLLFSFKLSIGKMAIAGVPLHTNEAIAALPVKNPQVLDRDYLRYALSALDGASDANHAVLGKVLNKSKVEALPIPLPPLPEQRRIVDVLARAEELVRLHREAVAKTREIIPALFLDMFGDPATNPKRWAKAPLDRILEISSALKLPNAQTEASIVCLGPDSILEGAGEFLSKPTVADVLPRSGKYCYRRGQVLYSKIRPYLAKAAIAEEDGFCSADMYAFTATHGCEPEFLLRLLLSSAFTEFATQESVRARIPKVNRETLSGYEAINPPLALQTRFTEHVARIRGIQAQAETALAKAQAAFQALLHRAFSG